MTREATPTRLTVYFTICMLLMTASAAQAQTVVRIVDQSTGEALSGSHIEVSREGKVAKTMISDISGKAAVEGVAFPFVVRASFIGYQTLEQPIEQSGVYTLNLSPEPVQMQDVVVTGQFEPQSIDESVFVMQSIDKKRIEKQAAVNLADVLSNNLNITLRPSPGGDRTSLEMLGLDGRYVKIMVDGIPLVGIEGNGNDADITQINMSGIERVEIVEGPMSVNFGANATAGVINLITKRSSENKVDASVSLQEETVGSEYGWTEGRHIQTLGLGYRINDAFYARLDYRHNDFRGLKGKYLGFDHTQNDGRRGFEWQPKAQHFAVLSLAYKSKRFNLRYALDLMDQMLDIPNHTVVPDEHPQTNILRPYAFDERYKTRRMIHKLSASGHLSQRLTYNIVSSFSSVGRDESQFRNRLLTAVEEEVISEQRSSFKTALSRGNFTWFTAANTPNIELGFEHNYEQILASSIGGGEKDQNNLALFANTEWSPIDKLTIRPGIRSVFHSVWDSPLIYSLNLKYDPAESLDLRFYYGASYRTPNLTELYYYFVDANHNVRGNAKLKPEDGYGYSMDIRHKTPAFGAQLSSALKLFYNDIQNQITLGVVSRDPLRFQYINVDQYKSAGFTLTEQLQCQKAVFHAGFSYIGRLNSREGEFLFSTEFNFNMMYQLSERVDVSLFYKRTGRREQLKLDANEQITKGRVDAFDWLDLMMGWQIKPQLDLDFGVKNLLDLTSINSTAGTADAHSAAPTSQSLAYGRSYFVRLGYQFNK